jgi:hypothetical protein
VAAAELLRLTDVKVMDMYATQGMASATATAPSLGSGPALASTSVQSVVEEWIDFAIIVEQMQ